MILTISAIQALDVPCVAEPPASCTIEQTINLQPDEKLNLINIENPNKLEQFSLHYPSTLSSLPTEIFEQLPALTHVYIKGVGIDNLSKEQLKNATLLRTLDLSKNKIKTVPKDAISTAPNLIFLDLSQNEIENIDSGALNSPALKYLYLAHNKLPSITNGALSGAPKLQEVYLTNNSIEVIQDDSLALPNLKVLQLNENKLVTLSPNLFTSAPNLERIDLRSNHLKHVLGALEMVPKLSKLQLDNNPTLRDLSLSSLLNLHALTLLSLQNTSLILPSDVPNPPESSALEYLNLSNNGLSQTNLLLYLDGLKKLKKLILNNNSLTKLDNIEQIGDLLPALEEIELENNVWDCKWLKQAEELLKKRSIYLNEDTVCVN